MQKANWKIDLKEKRNLWRKREEIRREKSA